MSEDIKNTQKQQLQKLLREYDANKGMAGFICSRPVELLPEEEQERMLQGFCTKENLDTLLRSIDHLERGKALELTDVEEQKINTAIPTLKSLTETLSLYLKSEIDMSELQQRFRTTLKKPIPQDQSELIDALSLLIQTVDFLSKEPVGSKDSWEVLIDSSQMYEALERIIEICKAIQAGVSSGFAEVSGQRHALDKTLEVCTTHMQTLEEHFKEKKAAIELQELFRIVSEDINQIWLGEEDDEEEPEAQA